jgi:ABC-2 type transport system permease protein
VSALRHDTAAEVARDGQHPAETLPPRRLSPRSVRGGGHLPLLLSQARCELVSTLRVPEFLIGVVAIPVMLFAMFGIPQARWELPGGTTVATMMMGGFGAFGMLSLVIFAFGVDIAAERGRGWLRLMRATPAPGWAYLGGKFATSVLVGLATLLALSAVAALAAQVRLPPERWAATIGVLLLGGLSLAPLGFALGFLARPRAASTVGNLVFLPLSFASGFFVPLRELPAFLRDLAPYLPTYHYGRLVWSTIAGPEAVEAYTGFAPTPVWTHLLWLAATFVAFALVALWAHRRQRSRDEA